MLIRVNELVRYCFPIQKTSSSPVRLCFCASETIRNASHDLPIKSLERVATRSCVRRSTIRWRADTDKKGKEWVIPIPSSLCEELKTFRITMGGLFGGLIFPSASDPTKPVTRDSFGHWLAAAERKAKLAKLDGSLWHAYRRAWATSRKGLPVVDVAAAGGWSDIGTLMKCYQQADDVTLLEVMSYSKKISGEARAG